jgi:hypothetical protein
VVLTFKKIFILQFWERGIVFYCSLKKNLVIFLVWKNKVYSHFVLFLVEAKNAHILLKKFNKFFWFIFEILSLVETFYQ